MAGFYLNDCYETLGLKPTRDIKEVKKAYARLVKQYHPEEDLKEYQKIMNAYKAICDYLSDKSSSVNISGIEQAYLPNNYSTFDKTANIREDFLDELVDGSVIKEVYLQDLVDNSDQTDYVVDSELVNEIAKMADIVVNNYNPDKAAKQKRIDYKNLKPCFDYIESYSFLSKKYLTFNNMNPLLNSDLYYAALEDSFFVTRFTEFLSKHQIEEELAQKILNDIKNIDREQKPIYKRIYSILEDNKITIKEMEKPHYESGNYATRVIWIIAAIIMTLFPIPFIVFLKTELFYAALITAAIFAIAFITFFVTSIINNDDLFWRRY